MDDEEIDFDFIRPSERTIKELLRNHIFAIQDDFHFDDSEYQLEELEVEVVQLELKSEGREIYDCVPIRYGTKMSCIAYSASSDLEPSKVEAISFEREFDFILKVRTNAEPWEIEGNDHCEIAIEAPKDFYLIKTLSYRDY